MYDEIKLCTKYMFLMYTRAKNKLATTDEYGNVKQQNHVLLVLKKILKIIFSASLGLIFAFALFQKTNVSDFMNQILLIHIYLFLLFFMRAFPLHLYFFLSKTDKNFYLTKPLKKYTIALSNFLFIFYAVVITLLPAILSVSIVALFRYSFFIGSMLFVSLVLLIPVSVAISGFFFYLLLKLLPETIFLIVFNAMIYIVRMLIAFMLDIARSFHGTIEDYWFFFPAASNIVFFQSTETSFRTLRFLLPFAWSVLFLLSFIFLLKLNYQAVSKTKIIKKNKNKFPTLGSGNKRSLIEALYKKIMQKDKTYKTTLFSNISTLLTLPLLLVIFNLAFGKAGAVYPFTSYFITALWFEIVLSCSFSKCEISQTPKAGWLLSVMQNYKGENREIAHFLILKRGLFVICIFSSISYFYLGFTLQYMLTVLVIIFTYLSSFLLVVATGKHDKKPSPFISDVDTDKEQFQIGEILLYIILPLIYILYFKINNLKLSMSIIFSILFFISLVSLVQYTKPRRRFLKHQRLANECN